MFPAKKNLKIFSVVSFIIFSANLAAYYTAYAQASKNQTSSQEITRSAALSLVTVPTSFSFKAIHTPGADRNLFSDLGAKTLPIERRLTIQDNRGNGGFTLQVSSTGFVDPDGVPMPNSLFKIVSSSALDFSTEQKPKLINTVIYEKGFVGDTNISTPINATEEDFGNPITFKIQNKQQVDQNVLALSKPVDILQGTLPSKLGRKGRMTVGLSFNALTRAFTKPSSYTTNLTYTLIDSTT